MFIPSAVFPGLGDDWEFAIELLGDMDDAIAEHAGEMAAALVADPTDWKSLESAGHAVKGAALNMHLSAVSNLTMYLETLGREGQASGQQGNKDLLALAQAGLSQLGEERARLQKYKQSAVDRGLG